MCAFQRSSGLVVIRWVSSGHVRVPYGSVCQSYTDTGQSSHPSGLVGSRRAISGSDGFPSEPCFGTTGPDGARRIARLSRIGAQLMYGPIRDSMASPRALRSPVGTQRARRTAGGTLGPRLIGASPVWAARSSYWRQPWLLYEDKMEPIGNISIRVARQWGRLWRLPQKKKTAPRSHPHVNV